MFLTLNVIFISVPLHAYYGFYKSFGYKKLILLKFWIPIMLIGMGLFLSIYFENIALRVVMITIFNILFLIYLRKTIGETLKYLKNKIVKPEIIRK